MTGWIGISLGDLTGTGPEVTLKAIAAEAGRDENKYLLIGDENRVRQLNFSLGLELPLKKFLSYSDSGRFFVLNPINFQIPENLPAGSPMAGTMAISWLGLGGTYCFRGELDALVTAPVNKEAIIRAGYKNFTGQTEYLSELAGTDRTAMMLLGLKISLSATACLK